MVVFIYKKGHYANLGRFKKPIVAAAVILQNREETTGISEEVVFSEMKQFAMEVGAQPHIAQIMPE